MIYFMDTKFDPIPMTELEDYIEVYVTMQSHDTKNPKAFGEDSELLATSPCTTQYVNEHFFTSELFEASQVY